MAKVYISSTSTDLREHREKLSRLLRRSGHEDVSWEQPQATADTLLERRMKAVGACDIYVGIFAWRYGLVPAEDNPEGLSITEMEYREARKAQKPCLIYLLSEDAPWPPKFIDRDRTPIEQLRHTLESQQTVEFFRTPEELVGNAAIALARLGQEQGFSTPAPSLSALNLAKYYGALSRRYRHLDLNALTPPQKEEYVRLQLRSVFVEQRVREEPPPVELPKELWEKLQSEQEVHPDDIPSGLSLEDLGRVRESYLVKAPGHVLDILSDEEYRRVIILGNPGSGKSTLARYILLSLISDAGDERLRRAYEVHLPLLIELRSYAGLNAENRFASLLDFVDFISRNEGWGLDKESLHHYLKTGGPAVVIFDGLDEIFDPAERERVTQRIVEFTTDYPHARVVVTSRVIGYRRALLTDAGFVHFTLQDLDEEQVAQFVDRWYSLSMADQPEEAAARRERILSSFRTSPSVHQLTGNPMLLTIMVIIGKHQELPRERWKLYEHAASVLLEHWDVNKHLANRLLRRGTTDDISRNELFSEDDKKELLRRLAFRMQAGEAGLSGNYIHQEQLEEEFETYLRERLNYQDPERAAVAAQAMIDQLRERNFILALYGANLYGFVHRAFLEYFCASAIVIRFEKTRELTLELLIGGFFGAHWRDKAWHEVLRLVCGMIDEKFAGEIVSHLATGGDGSERQPAAKLSLAIQCLSELRNLLSVKEPANSLLQALCSFYEGLTLSNLLEEIQQALELRQTLDSVGANWPDRKGMVDWLKRYEPLEGAVMSWVGHFIATVGKGDEEIHELILDYVNHNSVNKRIVALNALARGWHDEQTLSTLCQYAVNDHDLVVRRTAVHLIATNFHDNTQTWFLLRDWAANDTYEDMRSYSVALLGEYFNREPETLPLLLGWVRNSKYPDVRSTAIRALAYNYRDHPDIHNLLYEVALHDESEVVRAGAVLLLADKSEDNAQAQALLRFLAVNAAHHDVRVAAVQGLGKYHKDDAETLSLLRQSAVVDADSHVRVAAIQTLVLHYKDDPGTLALIEGIVSGGVGADTTTRAQAISAFADNWPNENHTLSLLDSLREDDHPETIREAAREASLKVRKSRVAAWVKWLNGASDEVGLPALPPAADGFPAITIRAVRLENIRAVADPEELHLVTTDSDEQRTRPLTILVGNNATGKSTWLRCIALAALGPEMANQLEKRPESYLHHGADRGLIEVLFDLQLDEVSERDALGSFCIGLEIRAGENSFLATDNASLTLGQFNASERLNVLRRRVDDRFGFLCGYGALRGLADNPSVLLPEEPKESHERVISLFRSTSPLMDPDVLGKMLKGDLSNFRSAPPHPLDEVVRKKMVDDLKRLLPEVERLDPSRNSCMTLHGVTVPLRDLSEGYGSLLALIGHLFRHALSAFRWQSDPSRVCGVVLIDEVDLHLHPDWQRRVLRDLREVFPKLQIICTTHSAMVAGSVSTDSVVVLRREDETLRLLSGSALPQVKGWTADEILTSILFELQTTRDVQTEEVFSDYADLLKERGPDDPEVRELSRRASDAMKLGSEGSVDTHTHQLINEMLIERFQSLDEQTRSLILARADLMLSEREENHDQD